MKLLFKGDKGRAMCPECGLSSTTYLYKDVPISESNNLVKDILVGVCDQCEQVVTIPAQSTPAIKEVRERTSRSIEAVLPAPYLEVLDLAAYTLTPRASKDMRKYLVCFYAKDLIENPQGFTDWTWFEAAFKNNESYPKKRLSFKALPSAEQDLLLYASMYNVTKTQAIKSIVCKIKEDILDRNLIRPEMRGLTLSLDC